MKKRKKARKGVVTFVSLIVIAVSMYMISNVVKEVLSTIELQKQLKLVEAELEVIESENAELISQKYKLEDPGYVESYARGYYMLSKEGEQIFYLSPKEK
ncbi:septum formation initiator family protein [Erysipelotrichaceae bacterium OH741_COT-311]|nr:septum formation initiator family protein [Erysipelotrichaceae bacterium]MDO5085647.1 septum formation initiator family protein [Erysipelotrichaceae bacterium]RRC91920.1 septum formation initiator family protein [Erysipelotrichaceae bacterium OH741_COT-311]